MFFSICGKDLWQGVGLKAVRKCKTCILILEILCSMLFFKCVLTKNTNKSMISTNILIKGRKKQASGYRKYRVF